MAIIIQVICISVAAYVLYLLRSVWRVLALIRTKQKIASNFPCLPKHWLWGNLPQLKSSEDVLVYTRKMMATKCHSFCSWFTVFFPDISIIHPEAVKTLIRTAEPKPMRAPGYIFVQPWLGDGLLLSAGKKWERIRRLLTPAFHFDILKSYVSIYNTASDKLVNRFRDIALSGHSFDVNNSLSYATLDIMLRCALSYTDDIQEQQKQHPYVIAVGDIGELISKRILNVFHYCEWMYRLSSNGQRFYKLCDDVHQFSDSIIKARKKALELDPDPIKAKGKMDFLDLLLMAKDVNGIGLTDLEIRNEVDTFMFAGHDTTACSLSWMMYSMAAHPEEQQKVVDEINTVMQGRDYVEWEDQSNLRYLSACLRESIRLYSTVPIITRLLTQPLEIDGKTLPAGITVTINIYAIHHNPDVWVDPEKFNPSRFIDESTPKNPYMYIPFSAGPRNCIGQNFAMHEMKVMLVKILSNFEILKDPEYSPAPVPEMVLRSKTGIKVIMKPRLK